MFNKKNYSKQYNKEYYTKNSDKIKSYRVQYNKNNRQKRLEYIKKKIKKYSTLYCKENQVARSEYNKRYRKLNKGKINLAHKIFCSKNKNKIRSYHTKRRVKDAKYKRQ